MHGIAAALPRMDARGQGHIVNVSSVGGFVVRPTAAIYAAATFAVRATSKGLRTESAGCAALAVVPGVIETELADTISDAAARERMRCSRAQPIGPDAIGRAVLSALEQPGDAT